MTSRRKAGTKTVMLALRVAPETAALVDAIAEKKAISKGRALDEAVLRAAKQMRISDAK